jgi:hypothetical protein
VKRKLTIKARADLDVAGHYLYLLERNPSAGNRLRQAVKAAGCYVLGKTSTLRCDLSRLPSKLSHWLGIRPATA